jgi:branched-chain amino acid transport system permease protein
MPDASTIPTSTTPASDCAPAFKPTWWSLPLRNAIPLLIGIAIAFVMNELIAPSLGGFASLLAFAGINIILAVSLNIVNGYAGQFSIGHAGFMSLGGYVGAAVVYYGTYKLFGDPSFGLHGGWLSYDGPAGRGPELPLDTGDLLFIGGCLAGGVVAAAAGWIVGLPSLRLRGDYLAIVTLGFGEIVRVIIQGTDPQIGPYSLSDADVAKLNDTSLPALMGNLGGAKSLSGLPTYATPFWIFVWVGITLIVAIRLKYSGYGRALLSIREDEVAARSIGVNVTTYNVRAFTLSAFFAGVGGVLFALNIGQIKASDLAFQRSFEIVIMVVLGGLGSVSGAVLAAILLTILPEFLRQPPGLFPWGILVAAAFAVLIGLRAQKKRKGIIMLASACLFYEGIRRGAPLIGVELSQFRMIFYALTLISLMILRPQGLFGVHEVWDVWPLKNLRWTSGPLRGLPFLRHLWLILTTGRRDVPASPPAIVGAGEPATAPSLDSIEHATPGDLE